MNIKSLIITAIALIGFSTASQAQKVAHINSSQLVESLPQLDSINKQLENLGKEYQQMLDAISKELEDKQSYWTSSPQTDPSILALRQSQYEKLATRYQSTQQEAQKALGEKQTELMKPLLENVKKVVQEVAKEKGYTYVFDSSDGGGMIYGDPSHDLMTAVKAKLNIK